MADKLREGSGRQKLLPEANPAPAQPKAGRTTRSHDQRTHQKAITQGLRKFFDSVASEPVPQDFLNILKKMDVRKKGGDG
jgi:hypothetical protein